MCAAINDVREKYRELTTRLIKKHLSITSMESCTSGLIASLITDTEGASAVFKGAYVTYSNEGKIKEGVPSDIIDRYGVYSPETAAAMADACRRSYCSDIGIGVTGTFGNVDPNNSDSMPGIVYFAFSTASKCPVFCYSIPAQDCRSGYKLYTAGKIVDRLLEIV